MIFHSISRFCFTANATFRRLQLVLYGLVFLGLLGDALAPETHAMETNLTLPMDANGWTWDGKEERYDRKTIYSYIDGAGELYLAYGFRGLVVRRYSKAGKPLLTSEIYEMGSSADAYGVFAFERQEEEAAIGQGSEFGGGLLRFWKGSYFVSINAEGEGEGVDAGVLALGRAVASSIRETGPKPQLIGYLPSFNGLDEKNIYFFRSHILLNQRFFIAHQNILHLEQDAEAVLARYVRAGKTIHLLLIRYPSEKRASEALSSFKNAYMPDARTKEMVKTEDGSWTGIIRTGAFLAAVFGAESQESADTLLKSAESKARGK